MSLFDWVEGGLAAYGVELPAYKGSYSSTMGDVLSTYFGARHSHIFGADIKLLCDPEDMLLGKLADALPVFTSLLAGVGGNCTFVYGSNIAATYVGPKVNIQRAPNAGKTSKYRLARMGADDEAGADEIDYATSKAVAALSILICATAASLELAMHFAYPSFGSGNEEEEEQYGKVPEILKTCVMRITDRLMALLKELECAGSWADFAEHFSKEAVFDVALANVLAGVFFPPLFLGLIYTTAITYVVQQVATNSRRVAEAS